MRCKLLRRLVPACVALLPFAMAGVAEAGKPGGTIKPSPNKGGSVVPVGQPVGSSYVLTFRDEFDGSALDTSKWGANWLGCPTCITPPVQQSNELAAYDPAQVGVANGSLHLKLIDKPATVNGRTYPYRSGMVQSHDKKWFTYGYFEARIFLPIDGETSKIANWPAWWTNGEDWPYDGENDIMEGLSSGDPCYHFHSPAGGPGGCKKGYFSGWHVYGALWESGKVSYYYDGSLVGTITTGVTNSPMYLILNYAISSEHGGNHRVPATMEVDYVRVWQR